jgi:uncharacterized protein with HEPN domain
MQPKTPALLVDAQSAATKAQRFLGKLSLIDYCQDELVKSAVERQLEIVGEALNDIRKSDPETEAQIPDIHEIIGLRNVLAHAYEVVSDTVIWDTVTQNIPELLATLDRLLADTGTEA